MTNPLTSRLRHGLHALANRPASGSLTSDETSTSSHRRMLLDSLDRGIAKTFHNDPEAAVEAYAHFNQIDVGDVGRLTRDLIEQAVNFDYVNWPRVVREHLCGRSVVDVGCGHGLHAVGYLIVGVTSYVGVDPIIDIDSSMSRNKREGRSEDFGVTPRQLGTAFPRLQLIPGYLGSCGLLDRFDLLVMHNVTEHLHDLEGTFQEIPDYLNRDGRMLYNHHNFYSWNGHHLKPKTVADIDPSDPAQRVLVDWGHLDFEPPEDHYIRTDLNRISLKELERLTAHYFDIEIWDEKLSKKEQGADRLTDEIRQRFPHLTDRDLLTQNIRCLARPKRSADPEDVS